MALALHNDIHQIWPFSDDPNLSYISKFRCSMLSAAKVLAVDASDSVFAVCGDPCSGWLAKVLVIAGQQAINRKFLGLEWLIWKIRIVKMYHPCCYLNGHAHDPLALVTGKAMEKRSENSALPVPKAWLSDHRLTNGVKKTSSFPQAATHP